MAQMWGSGQVQDRDRLLEIQALLCVALWEAGREGAGAKRWLAGVCIGGSGSGLEARKEE